MEAYDPEKARITQQNRQITVLKLLQMSISWMRLEFLEVFTFVHAQGRKESKYPEINYKFKPIVDPSI